MKMDRFLITLFIFCLPLMSFLKFGSDYSIYRGLASEQQLAKPLLTGEESLEARLSLIYDPDVTEINFSTFVFEINDLVGQGHIAAFIKAAKEGKKVNFLVDGLSLEGFGSSKFSEEVIYMLQQAGVNVYFYRNPKLAKHIALKYRRMHDKLLMVVKKGEKYLITGGRNTKKLYFALDEAEKNAVEFEVVAKGAAANQAFQYYDNVLESSAVDLYRPLSEWDVDLSLVEAYEEKITGNIDQLRDAGFINRDVSEFVFVDEMTPVDDMKFIHNDPNGARADSSIMYELIKMLNETEVEIYGDAQYFLPTDELREALQKAARRRLQTDPAKPVILNFTTNGKNSAFYNEDWKTTDLMYAELENLQGMGEGFNLAIHDGPDKIHSKVMVSDGKKCLVWSANIDSRSFALNLEVGVKIVSEEVCKAYRDNLKKRHSQGVKVYKYGKLLRDRLTDHLRKYHRLESELGQRVRSCKELIKVLFLRLIRYQL